MADQATIDEILEAEYSQRNVNAASKFLADCAYSTTALAALAAALDELDATEQANYVRACCDGLAAIEADEI